MSGAPAGDSSAAAHLPRLRHVGAREQSRRDRETALALQQAIGARRSNGRAERAQILRLVSNPAAAAMCCSVRVDAVSQADAVLRLVGWPTGLVVHLCNSYTLALARGDRRYSEMLNRADLNLPDGTPLAWLGKREGIPGFTRATRGPDLMRECLRAGRANATRHYLYGSTPEVLELLTAEIARFAPGAIIVGVESPPFGDQSEESFAEAAARMSSAGADVVWVGLGTPRQDWAADALGRHLDAVIVPVGAAFDFLAGTKREAPAWLRDSGFEWLFRLATEPRRLWRRYLWGNAGFVWGILRGGVRQV